MSFANRRPCCGVALSAVALVLVAGCGGEESSSRADNAANTSPSVPNTPQPKADLATAETDIRAAFDAYRDAVAAKDGDTAVKYVASKNFSRYDNLRKLALSADEDFLRRQLKVDQIAVVSLRMNFDVDELRTMTSQQIMARSVDLGLSDEQSIVIPKSQGVEPEFTVWADEYAAVAGAMEQGVWTDIRYKFLYESDGWKLDTSILINYHNAALYREGRSEEQIVDDFVASLGPTAAEKAWEPLEG